MSKESSNKNLDVVSSSACKSDVSAGVATTRGEVEKDAHHEATVERAGGTFFPLAVETLGLWSSASLKMLKEIAVRTTSRSGAPIGLATCHFLGTTFSIIMEAQFPLFSTPLQPVTGQPFVGAEP